MATTPFRITPTLGPALTSTSADNYWDSIAPDVATPSYQPGTTVTGNDGGEYVYVTAHANLAANAACTVSGTSSAAGTGYTAAAAVTAGDTFHAKKD